MSTILRLKHTKDDLEDRLHDLDQKQRLELANRLLATDYETSLETRYLLFRTISQTPEHLDELTVSQALRKKLEHLKLNGRYNFSRVAVQVLNDLLESGRFSNCQREQFAEPLQVYFVAPNETFRNNPQLLGTERTASFLEFMGFETYIFDMSLEEHREQLKQAITENGGNLGFVSMSNLANPLYPNDYESIFEVERLLQSLRQAIPNIKPRFVAGGRGASFNHADLLTHTAIELVFQRYGSLALTEMLLDTEYSGNTDTRTNAELFEAVPNLLIGNGDEITRTPRVRIWGLEPKDQIGPDPLRVVTMTLDPTKIDYRSYWEHGVSTDICSAYAFNPSGKLISPKLTSRGRNVHPAELYLQLRMVKQLSSTGNCQRGCRQCHYTKFSSHLFFHAPDEFTQILDRTLEGLPEVEVLAVGDDEFLSKRVEKEQLDPLLLALEDHPTRGRLIYSMETVAQAAQNEEVLKRLKHAGFKTVILGIENHVEDVVRHAGKVKPGEDFQGFIEAAKNVHDLGFYTKTSFMVLYPTLKEEELETTVRGILDYIDHGISVILFPLVVSEKRTGFDPDRAPFNVSSMSYQLPGGGDTIDLNHIILPQDETLKAFAEDAVLETVNELEQIKAEYRFGEIYPDQLEALAFMRSIVKRWKDTPAKRVEDKTIDDLYRKVEDSIEKLAYKSRIQLTVRDAVLAKDYEQVQELIKTDETTLPEIVFALRRYVDFGHETEITSSANLYTNLLDQYGGQTKDGNMLDSLTFRAEHSNTEVNSACHTAVQKYCSIE